MKVKFKVSESKVFEFNIDKDMVVSNLEIFDEISFRDIMRGENTVNESSLEAIFRYYMGSNVKLDKYLEHIKKNGFFSPYQPNLRVEIAG